MELHQFRYFVTVVREGTFTRAAERLYITQPSLSEQIRKLETELGSPLFQRLGRRLALTSAGEALLPHAERVLFEVEQARARVEEVLGVRLGRLSIGVLPSAAARLVPRLLAEFRSRHPGVEVELREEAVSADAEDLVHEGTLDLAIIRLPKRRADLDERFLVREPMVLVVAPGHRLADRRSVALIEVAEEPFVAMRAGHGLRDLLVRLCREAGFDPRISFETGQLASAVGLVLAGAGVTVVPRMAAGPEGRRVRVRDPHAYRDLGVVWRQGQPLAPAARIFLDMLHHAAELGVRNGAISPAPPVSADHEVE
ncbi:MAG TPA: LysR family transcriptional regulator [Candidatus Dormibacteraeota bacterium]|nr:LysR family transcriptional regulator [Candidatus Dormibacteraeota bacterium]